MVRHSLTFILALVLAGSVRADWTVVSSQRERNVEAGIEHRRVLLSAGNTGNEATLDLAIFSTKSTTVRVIDNPDANRLAAVMRRENCLAGANGGYFDAEDRPVGLSVSDGKVLSPLRKARLLSGVMVVSSGRIELQRSSTYSSKQKATAALQCGPFLADHGRFVPGLNDTRFARRTCLITSDSERAAIGTCSSVTLAQLARILTTPGLIPGLKVERALNLDGGSSSAFWFAGENEVFSIPELKTVRNFVAVVAK